MVDASALPNNRNKWPKVGIILLNWNSYEDTSQCLDSLKDIKYPNYDLYVVDNGSADNSGERLANEYNAANIILNDSNMGFAAGSNIGARTAVDDGVDYVLLLNNDTQVDPGFLKPLVHTAVNHDNVAGVSSVIYYADGDSVWFAGGDFDPLRVQWDRQTTIETEIAYKTNFLTGAVMLLPVKAINELGLFNDDFFFGGEDQDYVYRANNQGWNFFIQPQSAVYHEVGASSVTGSPFKYYHATRNRLRFSELHHSPQQAALFKVYFGITRLIRFCQWFLNGNRDRIGAVANGILDNWFERPVKKPDDFGITN